MKRRRILFYSLVIVIIVTTALLISGSPLLVKPLVSDPYIPLGTPITWLGIISLPLSFYLCIEKLRNPIDPITKYLSVILKFFLVLAVLWTPICYMLSGNFSNSFTEKAEFQGGQTAMKWFWRYTYSMVLGPLLILIVFWIFSLLGKLKK